ncbi:MAG: hypothetical protein ACK5ML_13145 [Lachnospiraceae bacterium]
MPIEPQYTNSQPASQEKNIMATAALILGIISLSTFFCVYLAFPSGALGITLALLSRGGQMKFPQMSKLALIISTAGFLFSIIVFVGLILFTLSYYGGYDGVMQQVMQIYGVDSLEELNQILGY